MARMPASMRSFERGRDAGRRRSCGPAGSRSPGSAPSGRGRLTRASSQVADDPAETVTACPCRYGRRRTCHERPAGLAWSLHVHVDLPGPDDDEEDGPHRAMQRRRRSGALVRQSRRTNINAAVQNHPTYAQRSRQEFPHPDLRTAAGPVRIAGRVCTDTIPGCSRREMIRIWLRTACCVTTTDALPSTGYQLTVVTGAQPRVHHGAPSTGTGGTVEPVRSTWAPCWSIGRRQRQTRSSMSLLTPGPEQLRWAAPLSSVRADGMPSTRANRDNALPTHR